MGCKLVKPIRKQATNRVPGAPLIVQAGQQLPSLQDVTHRVETSEPQGKEAGAETPRLSCYHPSSNWPHGERRLADQCPEGRRKLPVIAFNFCWKIVQGPVCRASSTNSFLRCICNTEADKETLPHALFSIRHRLRSCSKAQRCMLGAKF